MDAKLFALHQEYGKHTGINTCCTSTAIERSTTGSLMYCAGCQHFYVDVCGKPHPVLPADHFVPGDMNGLAAKWRQFVIDIGGRILGV
jgi:ribosomal protein L31